jgi:hypothetical protein
VEASEPAMNDVSYFFLGLLTDLPSLLTALVCILVAAARWGRHREVSLLAILGLTWFALVSLVFEAVFYFGPEVFRKNGGPTSLETFDTVMYVSENVLIALAMALLLAAVFIRRGPAPRGA